LKAFRHRDEVHNMTLCVRVARRYQPQGLVRFLATPSLSEFRQKLANGPSFGDFVSENPDRIVLGNTKGYERNIRCP
jgi:hypothetical protein